MRLHPLTLGRNGSTDLVTAANHKNPNGCDRTDNDMAQYAGQQGVKFADIRIHRLHQWAEPAHGPIWRWRFARTRPRTTTTTNWFHGDS